MHIKKFSIRKKSFIWLFVLLLQVKAYGNNEPIKETWLNIFVHGIIKTPWTLADVIRILHNCVTDSRYAYATEYVRNAPDYHIFQPMQEIGLKPVLPENINTNASNAIACVYNKQLASKNNLFYTFGWLGLLSRYHREDEGRNLLKALIEETEKLKKLNIFPKIRIISFSHGGNVALNIAKSISPDDLPFEINELILIGSPVQRETDHLINHPIFKKIYNFYSEGDIAQRADFLTSRYGVSNRTFTSRKDFIVPEKLVQIKLRTLKYVYCNGKIIRKNISDPNHMELWSFGWAQKVYRQKFPLNPLPLAAIIPTITQVIDQIKEDTSKNLLVTIIANQNEIIIKDLKNKKQFLFCLNPGHLSSLKCEALKFRKYYSYDQHVKLVQRAMTNAVERLRCFRRKMSKFNLKYKSKQIPSARYCCNKKFCYK